MKNSFTEAFIRNQTSAQVYQRGAQYYINGDIKAIIRRADTISAKVSGNSSKPYRVQFTFHCGKLEYATCSCPYDWGGWCKHQVAVALAIAREHDMIQDATTHRDTLELFSKESLIELILTWAEKYPKIEEQLDKFAKKAIKNATQKPTINKTSIEGKIEYWFKPQGLLDEQGTEALHTVLKSELAHIEASLNLFKVDDAFKALKPITDAYVKQWRRIAPQPHQDLLQDIGNYWAQITNLMDKPEATARMWLGLLNRWQKQIEKYVFEYVFHQAIQNLKKKYEL